MAPRNEHPVPRVRLRLDRSITHKITPQDHPTIAARNMIPADAHFPRERRVRKKAEFDRVYAGDAFAADPMLVVRGVPNGLPQTRLGLSVSRKVGNAVVRNRWKRRIREAFRLQLEGYPPPRNVYAPTADETDFLDKHLVPT